MNIVFLLIIIVILVYVFSYRKKIDLPILIKNGPIFRQNNPDVIIPNMIACAGCNLNNEKGEKLWPDGWPQCQGKKKEELNSQLRCAQKLSAFETQLAAAGEDLIFTNPTGIHDDNMVSDMFQDAFCCCANPENTEKYVRTPQILRHIKDLRNESGIYCSNVEPSPVPTPQPTPVPTPRPILTSVKKEKVSYLLISAICILLSGILFATLIKK
jgi:hypothetical protein